MIDTLHKEWRVFGLMGVNEEVDDDLTTLRFWSDGPDKEGDTFQFMLNVRIRDDQTAEKLQQWIDHYHKVKNKRPRRKNHK